MKPIITCLITMLLLLSAATDLFAARDTTDVVTSCGTFQVISGVGETTPEMLKKAQDNNAWIAWPTIILLPSGEKLQTWPFRGYFEGWWKWMKKYI